MAPVERNPERNQKSRPGHVVRIVPSGPMMVEGPVELVHDGGTVRSDRFVVAVCTCRRSRTYPLCDTSHRRRIRARDQAEDD